MNVLITLFAPPLTFFQRSFWNFGFVLFWVGVVAVWFFANRIPGLLRSVRAGSWPAVPGKIETAKVSEFGQQALGELGYSYLVEGERFSGYFTWNFGNEQEAWDYVNRLQGRNVVVRYKPKRPDISVLKVSDQLEADIKGSGIVRTLLIAVWGRISARF
jgi:hypothetical protein